WGLAPKADMGGASMDVRFVPKADISFYSIASSARASNVGGTARTLAVLRLITSSYLVGACTAHIHTNRGRHGLDHGELANPGGYGGAKDCCSCHSRRALFE